MRAALVSYGALLIAVVVIGCSDEPDDRPTVYPVSGTVTFKGKPVSGAVVTFASKKSPRPANATTNSDGKYSLTTFNFKDGAVEGEHQVSIVKTAAGANLSDPTKANAPDMSKGLAGGYSTPKSGKMELPSAANELPAKYSDGKLSALKATVIASGKNEINFDLEE